MSFETPASGSVRLLVYDVAGRRVRTLVEENRPSGHYQVIWDGHDDSGQAVASGTYFLRLSAGSINSTRRVVLLK